MANPRFIPNSCQVPNVIFDEIMPKISHAEFKVLMAVVRKTYGWGKDSDRISISQLVKMTGVSNRKVIDASESLSWILKTHKMANRATEFSIDIDADTGKINLATSAASSQDSNIPTCELSSQPSAASSQVRSKTCELSSHTKPNLKPTNIKLTLERATNGFEEFWKAYPKRVGKGAAEKAWHKLNPTHDLLQTILSAVRTQITWRENANGAFRPEWKHPTTWLNGKCWEDETETTEPEEIDPIWQRYHKPQAS